eukprot:6184470-Pleurochrysis_carterae.AAC.1
MASLISNVTPGATDDNKTLYKRKTGRPPAVSHFRPMFCLADASWSCAQISTSTSAPRPTSPATAFEVLEGPRKGKLNTTTQVAFRETVFPLSAEYRPPKDDTDGPSIDELMVMDDADDDNNVAAAPGVAAGMETDSFDNNTAPAADMDDRIASRVRRQGAPRPVLPDTTFA